MDNQQERPECDKSWFAGISDDLLLINDIIGITHSGILNDFTPGT